jgi:hypothetical protein
MITLLIKHDHLNVTRKLRLEPKHHTPDTNWTVSESWVNCFQPDRAVAQVSTTHLATAELVKYIDAMDKRRMFKTSRQVWKDLRKDLAA